MSVSDSDHWLIAKLRQSGRLLSAIGGVLTFIVMIILFVLALCMIMHGVFSALSSANASLIIQGRDDTDHASQITVRVLHGVELLFVAPLPFLVFLSIARYVHSFIQPQHDPSTHRLLSACEEQLHRVKTLVIALMTASVATDLLRRSVESISLPVAAAEGLVMVLLGLYWWALDRAPRHPQGHVPASR